MTINSLMFDEAIVSLNKSRENEVNKCNPRSVVVLGAGPAGLLFALTAIVNGCATQIIEKRKEGSAGRENMVSLSKKTLCILEKYGVYQSLKEEGLVYPPNRDGYVCVQLKDLEHAMKRVIMKLDPSTTFHYGSKVTEIISKSNFADLRLGDKVIHRVNVIVNAEGCKGSTNNLLKIERKKILPSVPIITAIFKDNRPRITGIGSCWTYMLKTAKNIASTCYHLASFARSAFFGEGKSTISGGLLLKTPGCTYLGFGFSKEISDYIHYLIESKQDKELKALVEKSIGLGFSSANVSAAFAALFGKAKHAIMASWMPYDHFTITEIGADYAEKCSLRLNDTAVFLAGDAACTVEPTTGLGCNIAIESAEYFHEFLQRGNSESLDQLLNAYDRLIKYRIVFAHKQSIRMRTLHRPDALGEASVTRRHPFEVVDPSFFDADFYSEMNRKFGEGNWSLPDLHALIEPSDPPGMFKIKNYDPETGKYEYIIEDVKKK